MVNKLLIGIALCLILASLTVLAEKGNLTDKINSLKVPKDLNEVGGNAVSESFGTSNLVFEDKSVYYITPSQTASVSFTLNSGESQISEFEELTLQKKKNNLGFDFWFETKEDISEMVWIVKSDKPLKEIGDFDLEFEEVIEGYVSPVGCLFLCPPPEPVIRKVYFSLEKLLNKEENNESIISREKINDKTYVYYLTNIVNPDPSFVEFSAADNTLNRSFYNQTIWNGSLIKLLNNTPLTYYASGDFISRAYTNGTTANDLTPILINNVEMINSTIPANTDLAVYLLRTSLTRELYNISELVGWWKLEETSDPLADSSGQNPPTNNTVHPFYNTTLCKYSNSCLVFDGVNDRIDLREYTNELALSNYPGFSVSIWLYHFGDSTNYEYPLERYSPHTKGFSILKLNTADTLRWQVGNGTNAVYFMDSNKQNDVWIHYLLTYDNSTKNVSLYKNGNILTSSILVGTYNDTGLSQLGAIGAGTVGGSYPWKGIVQCFQAWDQTLNSAEVSSVFNSATCNPALSSSIITLPLENYTKSQVDQSGGETIGDMGAFYTPNGYFGGAYEFDGYNDFVSLGNSTAINFGVNGSFTVSAWAYPMRVAGTDSIICDINGSRGYWLYLSSAGNTIRWKLGDETSSTTLTGPSIDLNKWSYLVGTYDGATGNTSLYLNGVMVQSQITTHGFNDDTVLGTASHTVIGAENSLFINRFNGTIDSPVIYNRTLTSDEIKYNYQHYNATNLNQEECARINDLNYSCGGNSDKYIVVKFLLSTTDNTATPQIGGYILNYTVNPNNIPTQNLSILNSTNPLSNNTNQNLTVYHQNVYDHDSDPVKNITDWRVNNNSIAVLNLPFEGGSNSIFTKDYSSYGHNGTVNSANWDKTGGQDGFGAYTFDGINDYINLGPEILGKTENISEFSISTWIKPKNVNGIERIVSKFTGSGSAAGSISLDIPNGIGKLRFILANSSGAWEIFQTSDQVIYPENWYYVAATFDHGAVRVYLNGAEVKSGTFSETAISVYNLSWKIAADNSLTFLFNGTIDDVQIWNRSLSPEQIAVLNSSKKDLIVSQETEVADVWRACVTPNDGIANGIENCSNTVTIVFNNPPTHDAPLLNSTNPATNDTNQNLTVYPQNVVDFDGDSVKNITDWRIGGSSIAVLNLPFEAGSNSTFTKDYSSHGRNGSVIDATYSSTAGHDNLGAYTFDGSNDYINFSSDILGKTESIFEMSISAWIYPRNISGIKRIFSKFSSGGSTAGSVLLDIPSGNGKLRFIFANSSSAWEIFQTDSGVLAKNTWYHVAATFDHGAVKVYINGVLVKSGTSSEATIPAYDLSWKIGADSGPSYFFNGTIDDLMVFDRALSPEQIVSLNNSQNDLMVSQETSTGNVWNCCVTPVDNLFAGETKCSNTVTILGLEVDVSNLSLMYTNSSHYSVIRFFMSNIGNDANLFNWTLNTNGTTVQSTIPTNLTAGENVFVFMGHNYPASGTYAVEANGTTNNEVDSEETSVIIE